MKIESLLNMKIFPELLIVFWYQKILIFISMMGLIIEEF